MNNPTQKAEIGQTYTGKVKKIVDFGAFVQILNKVDGLLHISQIAHEHVKRVDDYLREGDEIEVKVMEIKPDGKISLSRKALLDSME